MPDGARRVAGLRTSKFPVQLYVSLFNRCYRSSDGGWFAFRTPDDKSVLEQDNFTWSAMEVIGRKLNEMIALERAKQMSK